ncbi:MAG TPA: 50S ribosomal protein L21, partial [Solirubrobacteraceae bacterium]
LSGRQAQRKENRAGMSAQARRPARAAADEDKDMYAIVKTGGKQYRVEQGQSLLVDRLAAEEGASVDLEPLLWRSEETVFDAEGLRAVKVTAKVVEHVRGKKLRVFKFKPKRGYKRRTGHRQDLTQIEVTEITQGKAKAAAAKTASEKPPAAKPAGEKQPAGKAAAKAPAQGKAKPAADAKADGRAKAGQASKMKEESADGS